MNKECFKCGLLKDMSEFYRHPGMADGHLGKCKECAKRDVRENYAANPLRRKEYEHARQLRPERRRKQREYTRRFHEQSPEKSLEYARASRTRNLLQYKARTAVGNALRDGRLKRQLCGECGATERVQAHHHDYSKPLDVEWLCFPCHRELRHGQKVGP